MNPMHFNGRTRGGFTLLELLAAMAILALMVTMLFAAFGQASRAWLATENRVETFTQARAALDYMSRELSQAIATSNISFLGTSTNVAFIAPVSADPAVDLEEVVYQRNGNSLVRGVTPFSAGAVWNFYLQPQNWPSWPGGPAANPTTLADNIVYLRLTYVTTNGVSKGYWNSTASVLTAWGGTVPSVMTDPDPTTPSIMTNQAPAGVQIEIRAIDTRGATRLQAIAPGGITNAANVGPYTNALNQAVKSFTTFVALPNH